MDWERIFPVWRAPAKSGSNSTPKTCRLPVAQRLTTRFHKGKITNCSLPFHHATKIGWSENGKKDFQDCPCPASVRSLNSQLNTINSSRVPTCLSTTSLATYAIGRRLAD